ncbi:hypothetical protein A5683_09945 [Mycobacterium mantenii]|uniref:Uncharacterized protein n=1 Tax=Mycobacterium mantenii TaxID=560555 RepID=A0A1A2STH6_MYCNT|nr:hypothetical protein A5688_02870 [Mycobacterium mantenii]OBH67057.1 hypothetical protein A5683_09945 [Mycobacterium mantenii]
MGTSNALKKLGFNALQFFLAFATAQAGKHAPSGVYSSDCITKVNEVRSGMSGRITYAFKFPDPAD